jgi:NAD(P)H dehydrogenase (quinone)
VKLDGLKPETVEKALEGINTLVLIPIGHEKRQSIGKNFIEAAAKQKVKRVIMLSTFGAENRDYYFPKQFRPIEEALEQSNIPSWTIVRPNFYAENLLLYIDHLRSGFLKLPTGEGKFSPVCLVDVAELVKHIIWNPEEHSKKAYELTGPHSMNGEAMAELASKELDHPIRFKDISPQEVDEFLSSRNVPRDTIQGLLEFYDLVKKGRLDVVCIKDYEHICGHAPKDLSWFFKEQAENLSSKAPGQ